VTVGVVDGRLLTFIINCSAKATDLAEDGRYAFHAHQDPGVPHEFLVRGHAVEVTGPQRRGAVADRRRTVEAAGWSFDDEGYTLGYTLYELTIITPSGASARRPTRGLAGFVRSPCSKRGNHPNSTAHFLAKPSGMSWSNSTMPPPTRLLVLNRRERKLGGCRTTSLTPVAAVNRLVAGSFRPAGASYLEVACCAAII
jgi:hypothetical protein